MQAIRFGELFMSRHEEIAKDKFTKLAYQQKKPVMTSMQVRPDGSRVWVVATDLQRLDIEGFRAFDGSLRDTYTAVDRQIARKEGRGNSSLTRTQLYDKYRDLVESYIESNEAFRLLAEDTLKRLKKAVNLDAGKDMDVR